MVVSPKNIFSKDFLSRIPDLYQDHRDVLSSLGKCLQSHGEPYVLTELEYAVSHSTREGGFPAFLKRSLENGWGTEELRVEKAMEDEERQKEQWQRERERLTRKAEQERVEKIKARNCRIEEKVQETLVALSDAELEQLNTKALTEAESKIPKPTRLNGEIMSAAKEKLETLNDSERQELYEKARAVVDATIGNLLSQNHPGFQRALENQVLKEVLERYHLKTPLVSRWRAKVQSEAQRILKRLVIETYGPFNIDHSGGVT